MNYKGISVVPSVGEAAVAGGEGGDVDGGRCAVGLAGLAVVAGVLRGEGTVEGGRPGRALGQ